MSLKDCKWRVSLYLDDRIEIRVATVEVRDELGVREIVKMLTGPFDTPDDVLHTITELLEHAEWRGQQLRLPVTPA